MAKALLGHVGGVDPRLLDEMRRLQCRVHDLENELVRVRAENESLSDSLARSLGAGVHEEEFLGLEVGAREPALT